MWSIPDFVEIVDPVSGAEQSLTAPRTETEPKVCEWRWNVLKQWWEPQCGATMRPKTRGQVCRACGNKIVEGAEHG